MTGRIEIDQEVCKGCEMCIFFCTKKTTCLSGSLNAAGYIPAAFSAGGEWKGGARGAVVCPEAAIEVYRD